MDHFHDLNHLLFSIHNYFESTIPKMKELALIYRINTDDLQLTPTFNIKWTRLGFKLYQILLIFPFEIHPTDFEPFKWIQPPSLPSHTVSLRCIIPLSSESQLFQHLHQLQQDQKLSQFFVDAVSSETFWVLQNNHPAKGRYTIPGDPGSCEYARSIRIQYEPPDQRSSKPNSPSPHLPSFFKQYLDARKQLYGNIGYDPEILVPNLTLNLESVSLYFAVGIRVRNHVFNESKLHALLAQFGVGRINELRSLIPHEKTRFLELILYTPLDRLERLLKIIGSMFFPEDLFRFEIISGMSTPRFYDRVAQFFSDEVEMQEEFNALDLLIWNLSQKRSISMLSYRPILPTPKKKFFQKSPWNKYTHFNWQFPVKNAGIPRLTFIRFIKQIEVLLETAQITPDEERVRMGVILFANISAIDKPTIITFLHECENQFVSQFKIQAVFFMGSRFQSHLLVHFTSDFAWDPVGAIAGFDIMNRFDVQIFWGESVWFHFPSYFGRSTQEPYIATLEWPIPKKMALDFLQVFPPAKSIGSPVKFFLLVQNVNIEQIRGIERIMQSGSIHYQTWMMDQLWPLSKKIILGESPIRKAQTRKAQTRLWIFYLNVHDNASILQQLNSFIENCAKMNNPIQNLVFIPLVPDPDFKK